MRRLPFNIVSLVLHINCFTFLCKNNHNLCLVFQDIQTFLLSLTKFSEDYDWNMEKWHKMHFILFHFYMFPAFSSICFAVLLLMLSCLCVYCIYMDKIQKWRTIYYSEFELNWPHSTGHLIGMTGRIEIQRNSTQVMENEV